MKITCITCGRENVPDWDGNGHCVTCARDIVLKVDVNKAADQVALCKNCQTMKHLNADGLCGRCAAVQWQDHIHMLGCQALTEARNLAYSEARATIPKGVYKSKYKDLQELMEKHEKLLTMAVESHLAKLKQQHEVEGQLKVLTQITSDGQEVYYQNVPVSRAIEQFKAQRAKLTKEMI